MVARLLRVHPFTRWPVAEVRGAYGVVRAHRATTRAPQYTHGRQERRSPMLVHADWPGIKPILNRKPVSFADDGVPYDGRLSLGIAPDTVAGSASSSVVDRISVESRKVRMSQ